MKMTEASRSISIVAICTSFSRILGLLRDVLLFAMLGTGIWNSAFVVAFTLPNLFRRLLGEGALTSALIPVLGRVFAKEGREGFNELLSAVFLRLAMLLVLIVLLGLLVLLAMSKLLLLDEKWQRTIEISYVLFPYVLLVCLSAIANGALNVLGKFSIPALSQIWLNTGMIASAVVGMIFFKGNPSAQVYLLSGGVLIGGILQLSAPVLNLMTTGWRFRLNFVESECLKEVKSLFIPALFGAALFQINILISRLLALSIDESSAGILYLSSRLIELPLGVFSVSVVTVMFPKLSKLSDRKNFDAFSKVFLDASIMILAITVPAALGLIVLSEEILSVLFQWGLFEGESVKLTVPVLMVSAFGLPIFGLSALLVRVFHARQNMKTPLKLSIISIFINLVLCVIFMQFLGAKGLALATVISSAIHVLMLYLFLKGEVANRFNTVETMKVLICSLAMFAVAFLLRTLIPMDASKLQLVPIVTGIIVLSILSYMAFLKAMHFNLFNELRNLVKRNR